VLLWPICDTLQDVLNVPKFIEEIGAMQVGQTWLLNLVSFPMSHCLRRLDSFTKM